MSQDANQNYDNTPSQPPSGQPPYGASQNPYEPQPPTGYGTTPQNPYGAPPPQNPYEQPSQQGGYGASQSPYEAPPGYGAQQPPYGAPQPPYGGPQPPYGAPPGYGAPPAGSEAAFSGPAGYQERLTPLPLNQAVQQLPSQYRRVLTKPSASTFAEELRKASWDITFVQLLIMIVVGVVLGLITALLSSAAANAYVANSDLTGSSLQAYRSFVVAGSVGGAFSRIISVPLSFFIGVGIQYLIAKAFKGQGTFLTQGYTALLYQAPIYIISSLLGLLGIIPVAGAAIAGIIGLALFVYSVVLNVYQIMATHRLSGGKATAVVLIPYAIGFVLLLLCGIAFSALIFAALHNVH
jgi:Yip1 domain